MIKWKISEVYDLEDKKEIFVYSPINKNDCLEKQSLRELVSSDDFIFNMVYYNNKMIGYHFLFSPCRMKMTDRMVFWGLGRMKKSPSIGILFEDQNIRLLEYKDEDSEKSDYWLVGRWRDVE